MLSDWFILDFIRGISLFAHSGETLLPHTRVPVLSFFNHLKSLAGRHTHTMAAEEDEAGSRMSMQLVLMNCLKDKK